MAQVKILRIIARLNIGGPALHVILLTEGLDKDRFSSLLVCGAISRAEGDMSYYAAQKGIRPVYIPELKREPDFLADIIAFIKIFKIVQSEKPDIIHTHTAKAGSLGRLAGILYNLCYPRQKKIMLVHTFHGHVFEGYFNRFLTHIFIAIEKFLAYFSCKIITVSEAVRKDIISLGICNVKKIAVIALGLELGAFLNIPPRGDSDALNVGIVGRLAPIKNHYLFLESASRVVRDNPLLKVKFKIIGDGELRQRLEEYSRKLDIAHCVEFMGWQKDLVKVYSQLDIAAITSLNEGTPVSLIEAMASGRIVVATNVGGVIDLLGSEIDTVIKPDSNFIAAQRGIMVKSGDADGFSKALTFVLQNRQVRERIARSGRDYIRNKFSKERLILDIQRLYEEILSEHKFFRLWL